MSLEDKKATYMKRMAGMLILFAVLGSVVLFIASHYLSKVFDDAIPTSMNVLEFSSRNLV